MDDIKRRNTKHFYKTQRTFVQLSDFNNTTEKMLRATYENRDATIQTWNQSPVPVSYLDRFDRYFS